MSEQNIENNDSDTQKPEEQRELSNIEKYNLRKKIEAEMAAEKAAKQQEKQQEKKENVWLTEAVNAYKASASPRIIELIKDLDPESQLVVLKANAESRTDPNTSSLPIPVGPNKDYLWDNYTTFNQTKDKIEYNIPASELMNPNKNRKLLGLD